MNPHFARLAFTPTVRDTQQALNGRTMAPPAEPLPPLVLGERERRFIAARDSFYLATVSTTGWPHVQHRGGHTGFLRILDDHTLAFADYPGNRQYVSVGNLSDDPKAALIMVDYNARRRLKLLARIHVLPRDMADFDLLEALAVPPDQPFERVMVLDVQAFDWNCSQYISPRTGLTPEETP
jgi:predicted pyridoxine 5'-phosphate oxidase superfamily flavin-nucleotide-binding protein